MAIIQCPNGHSFDTDKHAQCPYCSGSQTIGVTVPLDAQGAGAIPGGGGPAAFPKTMPLKPSPEPDSAIGVTEPYQNVTQAFYENEEGISATVGWLVCIEGKKKGKDFRIHGERNFIGRSSSNDIVLDFDDKISSGANLILSYDPEDNEFYIQPGEHQKNNVKLNGKLLLAPSGLKDDDIIRIGETKLLFRAFCNDKFKWE